MKNIYKILSICARCALGCFTIVSPLLASYTGTNTYARKNHITIPDALLDLTSEKLTLPQQAPLDANNDEIGNILIHNGVCYKSGNNVLNEISLFYNADIDISKMRTMLHICLGNDFAASYIKYDRMSTLISKNRSITLKEAQDLANQLASLEGFVKLGRNIELDNEIPKNTQQQYDTPDGLLFKNPNIINELYEAYKNKVDTLFKEQLIKYRKNARILYESLKENSNGIKHQCYWFEASEDGSGRDSATHTEVMVVLDILYSLNSLGITTPFNAENWNDVHKKNILQKLAKTMFSRRAMCPTCTKFLSSLCDVLKCKDNYFIYVLGCSSYNPNQIPFEISAAELTIAQSSKMRQSLYEVCKSYKDAYKNAKMDIEESLHKKLIDEATELKATLDAHIKQKNEERIKLQTRLSSLKKNNTNTADESYKLDEVNNLLSNLKREDDELEKRLAITRSAEMCFRLLYDVKQGDSKLLHQELINEATTLKSTLEHLISNVTEITKLQEEGAKKKLVDEMVNLQTEIDAAEKRVTEPVFPELASTQKSEDAKKLTKRRKNFFRNSKSIKNSSSTTQDSLKS